MIAVTLAARSSGILGLESGARTVCPLTWYSDSFTWNARSTWATVPLAVTKRWFWGTSTRSKPCACSQLDTLATELASGANRERNCCGDSQRR